MEAVVTTNFLRYYDLEQYLFGDVHEKFHRDHEIDAFDLFSIIIWKAQRAKSTLARRLAKVPAVIRECECSAKPRLEVAASLFTRALFEARSPEERLRIAMQDWGFYLPMASAILTVLW